MIQKAASGELDRQSIGQAANARLSSMTTDEVKQHVQGAADTARQNGNTELAQQLFTMLQQHNSNPQALKDDVVSLIKNNPQILQHFVPQFAKGILADI